MGRPSGSRTARIDTVGSVGPAGFDQVSFRHSSSPDRCRRTGWAVIVPGVRNQRRLNTCLRRLGGGESDLGRAQPVGGATHPRRRSAGRRVVGTGRPSAETRIARRGERPTRWRPNVCERPKSTRSTPGSPTPARSPSAPRGSRSDRSPAGRGPPAPVSSFRRRAPGIGRATRREYWCTERARIRPPRRPPAAA